MVITAETGRKLDYAIIAVLVVALGYFVYDKFVLDVSRDAELIEAAKQELTGQAGNQPKLIAMLEKWQNPSSR